MPSISVRACSRVTPGLSRPMTMMPGCQLRSSGSVAAHGANGRKTSAGWSNSKPAGITPTMVYGRESRSIDLPIASAAPPNWRCHRP